MLVAALWDALGFYLGKEVHIHDVWELSERELLGLWYILF